MIKDKKDLLGKKITWTWLQGNFESSSYNNIIYQDGSIYWKGLSGKEKGTEITVSKDKTLIKKVADGIFLLSWFEGKDGYTVTNLLNFKNKSMIGVVSNKGTWSPSRGKINAIS